MLTIFCPAGELSVWETYGVVNGNREKIEYRPRVWRGWHVLDVPAQFFLSVILRSNQGKAWETANPEALAWCAEFNGKMVITSGGIFPGEGRGPLVAPVAKEVAPPAMVRLRAPAGVSSFSHNGIERAIGKDGMIEVDEHVGDVLRSHGFVPA